MSTITLTLEVSDELATLLAEPKRRAEAAAALAAHFGTSTGDDQNEPDTWFENLTPEEQDRHLARVDESLAAIDAGRTVPGHVVHQRLREKYGKR